MKNKNIFNSMGFAGRLGKLGSVITNMQSEIDDLSESLGTASEDIDEIEGAVNALSTLLDKVKALVAVTVAFNSDGGSSVASQSVSFGGTATEPDDPTKEGYTFAGWYSGETEFDFTALLEANVTLTAHWTENVTEGEE